MSLPLPVDPVLARRGVGLVCLCLTLCLAVLGCGRTGYQAPQGGATTPPSKVRLKRNVDIVPVRQERLYSSVEIVGQIDAEGQTEIAAGVSGVVTDIYFREGDFVEKDKTLLLRVDPVRFKALMAQAEANMNKAQANVQRMEAVAKKCDAALRDSQQTLDLRRLLLDNIKRAGRSAKMEERQEAQANLEIAGARLEVAKAEQSVCVADLDAAYKEVDASRALFNLARRNFELSEVRAPYSGQINQRKVTRGTYLEDKTSIATMADLSRLRLVGFLPERIAPIVRQMLANEKETEVGFLAGNPVAGPWMGLAAVATYLQGAVPPSLEFTIRPFPDQTFNARLFFLSTVADPNTHLFECKAEIPRQKLYDQLRPGFTAKIRCPLPTRHDSIIIPEIAVRASERGFVAFRPRIVTDKEGQREYFAEAVPLELGQREPGWVEVLKGLRPGDVVVNRGAEALEDNTPLAIPTDKLPLLSPNR